MKRRVLIVDDEVLVRIGIRHSVDWERCNFTIAGEASDGAECLRLMEKLLPDVIILDINMPKVDGIEVLKQIREMDFPVKVIVLTCYDEIEYARKAMKYGASDYVLKTTIHEDGLLNALNDLKFDENEKKQDIQEDERSQQEILNSILAGKTADTSKLVLKENHLFCIGIKILQIQEIKKRYTGKKEDYFQVSLQSLIRQALTGITESVLLQNETDYVYIFLSFSSLNSSAECIIKMRQIAERLSWVLQQYMALNVRIGVSELHYSFDNIRQCYDEVCQTILSGILYSEKKVFYFETYENENNEKEKRILEKEIKALILDRRYEDCLSKLKKYYEHIRISKGQGLKKNLNFLKEILFLVDNIENEETDMAEKVLRMDTFDEIQDFINKKIASHVRSSDNFLVNKAVSYLKEHYKEQISLSSLAAYMELSESYMSRLFNKEIGENISSYINHLRLTEAKYLLKNTNMKIYEIALEIGYSSTTAFHIVFKKSEGITPAEYRNTCK